MRRLVPLFAVVALTLGCGAAPAAPATPVAEGHACTSDADCASGLACCYPCGVEGCRDVCMHVEPGAGCPEIP